MKKMIFLGAGVLFSFMGMAQVVPLRAENWDFPSGAAEFGDGAMKIVKRGYVVLKNIDFADGTIEFDDQPMNERFANFFFHYQDSTENEIFYFRTGRGLGHPDARDGVQYCPTVKGVNFWNIMDHYQGYATFTNKAPNHVKLVISGKQMRVYVNSQRRPTLEIPRLEGNTTHGMLAFYGEAIISHLVLKPGQVEGLSPQEGIDPTSNDSRYIRHWQVTKADSIPKALDFSMDLMPGKMTAWSPLDAERRGLVNLTRVYGGGFPGRHIVWLKTTIHADSARLVTMRLGFLDEVWMFFNGDWLYVDKNLFRFPIAKVPDGRISLENATLTVPLRKGDNELLVAVVSTFFGWGIMARLDDIEGIRLAEAQK
jgi:hypothetical protein